MSNRGLLYIALFLLIVYVGLNAFQETTQAKQEIALPECPPPTSQNTWAVDEPMPPRHCEPQWRIEYLENMRRISEEIAKIYSN